MTMLEKQHRVMLVLCLIFGLWHMGTQWTTTLLSFLQWDTTEVMTIVDLGYIQAFGSVCNAIGALAFGQVMKPFCPLFYLPLHLPLHPDGRHRRAKGHVHAVMRFHRHLLLRHLAGQVLVRLLLPAGSSPLHRSFAIVVKNSLMCALALTLRLPTRRNRRDVPGHRHDGARTNRSPHAAHSSAGRSSILFSHCFRTWSVIFVARTGHREQWGTPVRTTICSSKSLWSYHFAVASFVPTDLGYIEKPDGAFGIARLHGNWENHRG